MSGTAAAIEKHGNGEHSKKASATKRGPGRFHSDGATKATPPKPLGAGRGFVVHRASPARKARRAAITAAGSARQFRRQRSAALRAAGEPA